MQDGIIKICDFGLSKVLYPTPSYTACTCVCVRVCVCVCVINEGFPWYGVWVVGLKPQAPKLQEDNNAATVTMGALGTPGWSAPEVRNGSEGLRIDGQIPAKVNKLAAPEVLIPFF